MSSRQVSQWRTVGVVLVLALMLVLAFRWIVLAPVGAGEFHVRMFDSLAWTLFLLALVAAGKSSVEHLAAGGGLRGAARALFTESKPGEPAEPRKDAP